MVYRMLYTRNFIPGMAQMSQCGLPCFLGYPTENRYPPGSRSRLARIENGLEDCRTNKD